MTSPEKPSGGWPGRHASARQAQPGPGPGLCQVPCTGQPRRSRWQFPFRLTAAARTGLAALARPVLTILVPAWRLPAAWCTSISYLLNRWIIPTLVAFAVVQALHPHHPHVWQRVTAVAAAVILVAKVAAVELHPTGDSRR